MTTVPSPSDPNQPQPPGMPGWIPPPPPGQPALPVGRKGRVGLVVGVVVLGVLALCGVGGAVAVFALKPAAQNKAEEIAQSLSELKVGDCVQGRVGERYHPVSCSSDRNVGTVIKVFPGTEAQGQDCPAETDLMLVGTGTIACARATTGERRGAPGNGGGVIVAGDCLGATGEGLGVRYKEVACSAPDVYERVVARAGTAAACPAPAVRYIALQTAQPQVVCIADGPGSAGLGECLGRLSAITAFDAVPCSGPAAGAKVLARKPTSATCESVPGMTHSLEDSAGLPATRFVCVKML